MTDSQWQPETLTLTTAHSASSYGVPVLVIDGEPYGPADLVPGGIIAADLVDQWAARFSAPNGAPSLAAELVDALKAIYKLTGFTFSPDRRSVAVADLAGRALERAGIDPAAVIRGEV